MTDVRVTYGDLRELLLGLGFEESRSASHRVFRHAETDTLIVYGPSSDSAEAPQAAIVATRRHLVEKGLLEEEAFSRLLSAAKQGGRRPGL